MTSPESLARNATRAITAAPRSTTAPSRTGRQASRHAAATSTTVASAMVEQWR